ncbi:MAG TPA: phytanoyl-CoA dioxygenase family protein [Chitinophagaceae bacterium]|nr:phytanoyl-CoA dioxygenase family protein [Chitinophagaceae bacterium]
MSIIQNLRNKFYKYKPVEYNFSYHHFKNEEQRMFYAENGYVVIKDIVSDYAIDIILKVFDILKTHKDYYEVDGFITSANYGFDIQKHLHQELRKVNSEILNKIFDVDKIYYDLLNVLVIKFNKDKKEFYAHQDIPLVEETLAPTTYAWIPTTDINDQNGALLVLPKSHKWFRWQRTHDQSYSPLKNIREEVLNYMKPIYLNKGDLILFDNSLIHASAPNFSNEIRVAMNTGIAPNNFDLIHYQKIENNQNKIGKYRIDEDFWLQGHYLNSNQVPQKYCPATIEQYKYQGNISKSNFIDIIKSS